VARAPLLLLLLLPRPCSNAPRGTGAAVIIGSMAVYREGERERGRDLSIARQTRALSHVVGPPVNCKQQRWVRVYVCEGEGGGRGGDGRIHVVHSVTAVQPVRSTRTCSHRQAPSEVMAYSGFYILRGGG